MAYIFLLLMVWIFVTVVGFVIAFLFILNMREQIKCYEYLITGFQRSLGEHFELITSLGVKVGKCYEKVLILEDLFKP